jgi:hypothetical protein
MSSSGLKRSSLRLVPEPAARRSGGSEGQRGRRAVECGSQWSSLLSASSRKAPRPFGQARVLRCNLCPSRRCGLTHGRPSCGDLSAVVAHAAAGGSRRRGYRLPCDLSSPRSRRTLRPGQRWRYRLTRRTPTATPAAPPPPGPSGSPVVFESASGPAWEPCWATNAEGIGRDCRYIRPIARSARVCVRPADCTARKVGRRRRWPEGCPADVVDLGRPARPQHDARVVACAVRARVGRTTNTEGPRPNPSHHRCLGTTVDIVRACHRPELRSTRSLSHNEACCFDLGARNLSRGGGLCRLRQSDYVHLSDRHRADALARCSRPRPAAAFPAAQKPVRACQTASPF